MSAEKKKDHPHKTKKRWVFRLPKLSMPSLPRRGKTPEKKGEKHRKKRRFIALKIVVVIGFLGLIALGSAFWYFILRDLPSPDSLSQYEIPLATKVYDRNGTLLYEIFADQNRSLVTLDQIPLYLQQATIAVEDKDFYSHRGVNPIGGILRALKSSIEKQRVEGGSTITQQLIKNALLTPERTIQRKIKEIVLATWAEIIYSKEQILELYLNQVAYGGTAWGIDAAAHKYFNKPVSELTLAESALLAGLPQSPTRYSPFGAHPELALERQHQVLDRMVAEGYITADEAETAKNEKLTFALSEENIKAPHFVMYIKDKLVEEYGEKVVEQGGLKVTTTLDLPLQEFAEETVASEVADLADYDVGNGAALVTRPPTGEILAMVGSTNYFDEGQGNVNVTTRLRQPGSSIKPINFAIAIENRKITPSTVFLDVPTCFQVVGQKAYCPKNYDGKFHGPVQTRFALGNSLNIPAVKTLQLNTVESMVASASAFGLETITDASRYGLSLTLGGGEIRMVDMAEAFSTFANAGKRKDLTGILKVEDKHGTILYEFHDENFAQNIESPLEHPTSILIDGPDVLSPETSFLISHILLDNNARAQAFGTHSELVVKDHQAVSVKTGTTDDLRDNWTIGFTPNFLVATWVGNNDNSPMNPRLVSGVSGAAPIWNKIMSHSLANQKDLWPRQPTTVIGRSVCTDSGRIPVSEGSCPLRFEYFIEDKQPGLQEPTLQHILVDKETHTIALPGQTENVEDQEHPVVRDVFGDIYCMDCSHENEKPLIKIIK